MSYDFATMRVCPHQVFFEKVSQEPDRQTAKFPRPPASAEVALYVDRARIPQGGLYSHAELPLSNPEPYRVKRGVNDMIYLSQGFGAPALLQLTPGPEVSARDMATGLQKQLPDLAVTAESRRIVFRSLQRTDRTAFQFHDPRWTDRTESMPNTPRILAAYKTLGIVPGRAASGRQLFPGWRIMRDTTSPLTADRVLVMDQPLLNADPLLEVSYVTAPQYCRRCNGTQIEFDYSIKNHTYETVRDTDLLSQEFDKFLITKIGSHWKWNWLGSGLIDRIGGKGTTGAVNVNALISVDVSQAFSTYQNIKQQQDSKFPQQRVSDAEYPLSLAGVDVKSLPDDPTVSIVVATVVSRSREPVELKRVIGNPSPFNLTAGDPLSVLRFRPNEAFRFRG